jgi:hypothetical protein
LRLWKAVAWNYDWLAARIRQRAPRGSVFRAALAPSSIVSVFILPSMTGVSPAGIASPVRFPPPLGRASALRLTSAVVIATTPAASPPVMPCVELALTGSGICLLRQRDRQDQSGAQRQNTRQESTAGDFPPSIVIIAVHSDHLLL